MRRCVLLVAALCLVLLAFGLSLVPQRSVDEAESTERVVAVGSYEIGPPVRYGNLTVFPVLAKSPRTQDRFTTLDEGLKAGTVEVFEVGAESNIGNEVNRLMVRNRSGKPLYLMPGEVIVGGYQDRTIGQETVIASGKKAVPVDVYCVEQGRWAQRDEAQTAAMIAGLHRLEPDGDGVDSKALAIRGALALAEKGNFSVSAGYLGKESRLAALKTVGGSGAERRSTARLANSIDVSWSRGFGALQQSLNSNVNVQSRTVHEEFSEQNAQQRVWYQVARANARSGAANDSGTFSANFAESDVVSKLKPYIDHLRGPISERARIVGVVVAVNGKIESAEVFESTPLFHKLWPKLLRSYALDAVVATNLESNDRSSKASDAATFLKQAMSAGATQRESTTAGLHVISRSSNGIFSYSAAEQRESSPAVGGGFGGAIHASAFSR